jgi:hypothetical protein
MNTFLIVLYLTVCVMLLVQGYSDGNKSPEGWDTTNRLGLVACFLWPPILLIVSLLTLALHVSPTLREWNLGDQPK